MADLVRIRGISAEPPDRINTLQQVLSEGGKRIFDIAPNILFDIIQERVWVGRRDKAGTEFKSFEAFAAEPLWDGLGCNIDDLKAICRKRPDVQEKINEEIGALSEQQVGKGKAGPGRGHKTVNNVNRLVGNNPTYALKRLKRDHPELAEKVVSGELSANAAAIKAGFRKQPTPLDWMRKGWKAATPDQRAEFLAEISAQRPESPQRGAA